MSEKAAEMKRETDAYLAKIRETVRAGKQMIAQAELRIAETDRLLEKEGLTREQLLSLSFTEEQKEAVEMELARRGLPSLREMGEDAPARTVRPERGPSPDPVERDGSAENRRRKFGVMMQQFRM